jgi:hypothetical protein
MPILKNLLTSEFLWNSHPNPYISLIKAEKITAPHSAKAKKYPPS